MNSIEQQLKQSIAESLKQQFNVDAKIESIGIEIPKDKNHGDYSSNVAMQYARNLKMNPRNIAQQLVDALDYDKAGISKCEIAGPGFINFTMKNALLSEVIRTVLNAGSDYGKNNIGQGLKVNCEYVSANPTGDLHLGHARGAAWGDSVTRLMKASGYDVTREYYVNDGGNQVINLGKSLQARYLEYFHQDFMLPEDGYHGEDVKNIAVKIAQDEGDKYLAETDANLDYFTKAGIAYELAKLKKDLQDFRVEFDVWTSEQSIRDAGKVEAAVTKLTELGKTYEADGALWFKTSDYGDDKDRVLRKADGSYTYLVPDIAYHIDKLNRGFDKLVDFFGADHHGYIARLKASIEALGRNSDTIDVDIIQMVRLVENGTEVKMSKRLGNAVTLRDLCEEVGVDAVRYFFVSRALDTHFDFDLGLARSQSNDNPVYYAQYAHARMCSILRAADTYPAATNYDLLVNEKELELMKYINEFTNVITEAAKTRSPNKVCNYIQKLAALFHSFYGVCKVNDPQAPELSAQRLDLLKACKITLSNALNFIGVAAIEKM